MMNERKGLLLLLAGAVMISFSAVFVKLAHVGPTTAGFYRMLFGGLLLLIIVVARRGTLFESSRMFILAGICGLAFAVDLTLWHRSIHYVGPGLSTLLANLQVFFLAAYGILVLGERLSWRLSVSIPLAVVGLIMIIGVDFAAMGPQYQLGVLFGILTAMAYASYLLTLRKLRTESNQTSSFASITVISLISALLLGLSAIPAGESLIIPDSRTAAILIAYGFFGQVAGWMLIAKGLPYVDASRAGLVLLLQPALSFVWDILFFHRPTTVAQAVGATLALAAIYIGGLTSRSEPALTGR
jgi:drug/metabolite transporter (DMT)-like permease